MSSKELPYVTPDLESIVIRGKYKVFSGFEEVKETVTSLLEELDWGCRIVGESLLSWKLPRKEKDWTTFIKGLRGGIPVIFNLTVVEHLPEGILTEVECRPVLYYRMTKFHVTNFLEHQIKEAQLECKTFVKRIMSSVRAKEVEPVSVYPIIPRMEIKNRLMNLGLKKVVEVLNRAERHIIRNDFAESLNCSRTAFERMIDWQMSKRNLGKTNKYKNDIERLKAKGYLDSDTAELLQKYYDYISIIGVHEKGVIPAGMYEAQMGYGITLIVLEYFINKLS